jgi:hypothetical protein
MPLTRISSTAIGADSITSPKLAHDLDLDGQFVRVPHGTTAQRPSNPVGGYLRFNTSVGTLEQYNTNTNAWAAIDSPPIISSLAYAGSKTAADPAGGDTITISGTNFQTGLQVSVSGTNASSVTFISSSSVSFVTPAKTVGDYDVVLTNPNGLAATLTNGISYNGNPAWTTSAGSLGELAPSTPMSTITVVAAEPDGGTIAYSVTTGSLPAGLSLGSANGQITGTPSSVSSTTTTNFSLTATDNENQTTPRAFSLTVLRPIFSTEISNSLKFESQRSTVLARTGETTSSTYTLSMWFKRSRISGAFEYLFSSGNAGVALHTDGTLYVYGDSGSGLTLTQSTDLFRDVSGWYHLVMSVNSNTATVYINGQSVPGLTSATASPLSTGTNETNFGMYTSSTTYYYNGYIADAYLVDGTALTPTSFGEEYRGQWTPKAYTGSVGTSGFHLNFADSSNHGNDVSTNTNDFTGNGFVVGDSTPDSPTNNFCMMNQQATHETIGAVHEGGLKLRGNNGTNGICGGTYGVNSGKWYFEHRTDDANHKTRVGFRQVYYISSLQDNYGFNWSTGGAVHASYSFADESGSSLTNNEGSATAGDIIGHALDLDSSPPTLKFYLNGTLKRTYTVYNKSVGYTPSFYDYSGSGSNNSAASFNFGQDSSFYNLRSAASNADANGFGEFAYPVPSGYLAMCSKNLADSAINVILDDQPEDYMDTKLYVGNGGTQTISGLTFQPDLVWLKDRTTTYHHQLFDSVRGVGKMLSTSNITNAEQDDASTRLSAFTSDGFTIGSNAGINDNSSNYVAWTWKAGGAPTATNTAGTGAVPTAGSVKVDGANRTTAFPTSGTTMDVKKMSVNTKAGFSIIQYTGTGAATNMPHGLNSTPEMLWIKSRSQTSRNWAVWHKDLSGGDYSLRLPVTAGQSNAYDYWNGDMTDTYINLGAATGVADSGISHICYAWHSIPGYSKISSYDGNGVVDGTYVYCGFKPSFVLIKAISATESWYTFDNETNANGNNPHDTYLNPSSNLLGGTGNDRFVDFNSVGFKIRGANSAVNHNVNRHIYMAFAENPFKYGAAV